MGQSAPSNDGPAYADLTGGGVLECVLALGQSTEEPTASRARSAGLVAALHERGLRAGVREAAALLAVVGRTPVVDGCSTYLSRRAAVAGDPAADLVVRVVAPTGDDSAPAAARALVDGLQHAAVTVYLGHLRYGVGPDFGSGAAPAALADAAVRRARATDRPVEEVLDGWLADGSLDLGGYGGTGVVLGTRNFVPSSGRARVEHWLALHGAGPVDLGVGDEGRAGRLWILLSCRGARLFPELRRTVPARAADLVGAPGLVSLSQWHVLPWFVDALRARAGWAEIVCVGAGRSHAGELIVSAGASAA